MTRMPSEHDLGPIEGFALRELHEAADTMRHLMRFGHHDAPQPAAAPQPAIIATDTPEDHMFQLDEIADHVKAAAAKLETLDHDALDALERVQANPDTAEAFMLLDQLTHLPVGESVLNTAIAVLRMAVTQPVATQPASVPAEPAFVSQAAGPVTGGVA